MNTCPQTEWNPHKLGHNSAANHADRSLAAENASLYPAYWYIIWRYCLGCKSDFCALTQPRLYVNTLLYSACRAEYPVHGSKGDAP